MPDSGDYVVLYINCTRGKFRAFGLFADLEETQAWIDEQEEPTLYSIFPLEMKV